LTWWLVALREQPPGGLTCDQVQQLVDAYAKGKLDEETRRKVRQHVTQCPQCGPRFKAMGLPA
jgi:anti-sigma factor RsiW